MTRRYAETTKVPVAQSQAEISSILEKNGIEKIGMMKEKGMANLWFEHKGRFYQLNVPIPEKCKDPEQEMRRAWRVLILLVKAKFEAIAAGISNVEEQFYADTIMPDGQKLINHIDHQITTALQSRQALKLGFGEGK
jgi:hypothetical protein